MMTFYFYDLETSGLGAATARIMQFAGQRTDMDLEAIGEADNILIKMTQDVLPEPDAVLLHGVTPQQTISDGLSEAEFLKYFHERVATADTIFVGFNNIRFDDDFMRFCNWRNFYDAYEWAWKDGRSRWDLLDVARMTRALRPKGIIWPFAPDGDPSNRLELLASVNKLKHANAHDALSDVRATIDLAKLIKSKQPKLFDYLLNLRLKAAVSKIVSTGQPFIYSTSSYPSKFEKTSVAVMAATYPGREAAIVYDLRVDPTKFTKLSAPQLAKLWQDYSKGAPYFPLKVLYYNRAPAVAPMLG
jgi:exodeoxyribonuclease-1